MANHGVFISQQATSVGTPIVAESGIPFVPGASPIQAAGNPAAVGIPALCATFEEFAEKLGYSDDWASYPLCEFAFSHFNLFGCQPMIACNLLDPATMKSAVAAADLDVADHKVLLPIEAINDAALVIKPQGGSGSAYVKDTDYDTFYSGEKLVIELLSAGSAFSATKLNVAYNKVTAASVNDTAVAAGMEKIELCMTTLGIVPDLICAPGYSDKTAVAAAMATKAAGINGMFKAKALIDISTAASGGADSYDEVAALKASNNFTDKNQILCWGLLKLGSRTFHYSTQLAGLMALTDSENGGCPYVSPSNKALKCDAMVNAAGAEINLTLAQANILNAAGVVTALNFMGGWKAWGNYTACYPASTDVKDYFIPISRMFAWIGNTLITTFWSRLDLPMNRRLIDSIVDTANIWLNGLVGSGYLLGARVAILDSENPLANLMAGKIKTHIYATPPSPAQEFEFTLEYDAEYVVSALS